MKTQTVKIFSKKIFCEIAVFIFSSSQFSFGQIPWQLGGNPNPPLTTTNNIFGTKGNFPIRIITNNTQYMYIHNNVMGSPPGALGIGTNFSAPQSLLHIHDGAFATYTQITNASTNNTATDGFKLGIAANGTAELRQQEDAPIDIFSTNSKRAFFSTAGFFTNNNTSATGYGLRVSTL